MFWLPFSSGQLPLVPQSKIQTNVETGSGCQEWENTGLTDVSSEINRQFLLEDENRKNFEGRSEAKIRLFPLEEEKK